MNEKRFFDPCKSPKQPESIKNVSNYLNGRVMDIQDAIALIEDCGHGVVEDHPNYGYITLTRLHANHAVEMVVNDEIVLDPIDVSDRYRVIRYADV